MGLFGFGKKKTEDSPKQTARVMQPKQGILDKECNVYLSEDRTILYGIGAGNYTIPDSVRVIAENAFTGFEGRIVELPFTVRVIEKHAFKGCRCVEIRLPYELESIGFEAFAYSPNLTSVDMPLSLHVIEDRAYAGCPKIQGAYLGWNLKKQGSDLFAK